jgi:hypothetical protein
MTDPQHGKKDSTASDMNSINDLYFASKEEVYNDELGKFKTVLEGLQVGSVQLTALGDYVRLCELDELVQIADIGTGVESISLNNQRSDARLKLAVARCMIERDQYAKSGYALASSDSIRFINTVGGHIYGVDFPSNMTHDDLVKYYRDLSEMIRERCLRIE